MLTISELELIEETAEMAANGDAACFLDLAMGLIRDDIPKLLDHIKELNTEIKRLQSRLALELIREAENVRLSNQGGT